MKNEIFDQYAKKVADHFDTDIQTMFSTNRNREVCDARHLFCYLCRERNTRYPQILKYMESKGYTGSITLIRYGHRVVSSLIRKDKDYAAIVKRIASETQVQL